MYLFVHKDRHIVVSETEKPEQGELQVAWVALSNNVDGISKRGRRPNYTKPVPVADLVALDDVDDSVRNRATAILASVAPETTEQ